MSNENEIVIYFMSLKLHVPTDMMKKMQRGDSQAITNSANMQMSAGEPFGDAEEGKD